MIVVIMGLFSFLLFGIYDINQVKWKRRELKSFFFIGLVILIVSTLWLLISSKILYRATTVEVVLLIISLGFFILLYYSLFLAIPFGKTYIGDKEESKKTLCDKGMYGLCRHPGFLCFAAAYLFLALSIQNMISNIAVAVYIFCNFLYVLLQDRWTFPHIFEDYENYRKNVPFLIPTARSIQNSFMTPRKEG